MYVKPFEIVFLLIFVVFFFGLIAYLVVNILKDSFDSIFDCDYYDAIKSNSAIKKPLISGFCLFWIDAFS